VTQLEEVIQQLQQRITDLELCIVLETPQEIRDLKEAIARSAVDRLKTLASECSQLSTRSAQTYETLAENPELQTLEAQLQEAKQHADVLQAQLKSMTPVKRMKRFAKQRTAQQEVHTLQSKVMVVSQRLQPLQEKACQLFTELDNQEAELEQVSSLQNNT
jgi:chromosome segregation ATPase